ncbi:MAG: hypothetical protein HUU29_09730 [Planctomycetaceae bacterium]|nr:hypothetical protein [Planctomycetaceae bacterium]
MLVVAIGGNSFFYAQAFFIFSDQSAKDVSAIANCIAAWALMSWLVYGIVIRNRILVVANIIGILGILLILLGIAMYR